MAMDPSRSTPKDASSVKTLQSMTEESAKQIMRQPVDNAWGQAKFNLLDLIISIVKNLVTSFRNGLRGLVGMPPVSELPPAQPIPELEPSFNDLANAVNQDYKPALTQIEELRSEIDRKAPLSHTHKVADLTDIASLYVLKAEFNELQQRVAALEAKK